MAAAKKIRQRIRRAMKGSNSIRMGDQEEVWHSGQGVTSGKSSGAWLVWWRADTLISIMLRQKLRFVNAKRDIGSGVDAILRFAGKNKSCAVGVSVRLGFRFETTVCHLVLPVAGVDAVLPRRWCRARRFARGRWWIVAPIAAGIACCTAKPASDAQPAPIGADLVVDHSQISVLPADDDGVGFYQAAGRIYFLPQVCRRSPGDRPRRFTRGITPYFS